MGLSSPYALVFDGAFAITPSDSVNFAVINGKIAEAAIYVGGAGVVVAITAQGETATFTVSNVPFILPGRFRRVNNTNTTATLMLGCY